MTSRRFWCVVAAIWGVAAILLVVVAAPSIVQGRYPDPDDQMRLLEVRDWLGGQSWFDVTQYRLNAPAGVPMHWSRLVDLPIAAVILAARPLLGMAGAERLALVVVPLLTLGVVLAALAGLGRRLLANDEQALMAVCVALLCVEVIHQLAPMRIDHHGWQMACAVIASWTLVGWPGWRNGAITGIVTAVWLSISLEGLPMVATILALVALRWALELACRALLVGTATGTAAVATAIFAATHVASAWRTSACDAVSPVYLAMLATAALGIVAVTALPVRTRTGRLVGLAIVGIVALAPLPLLAPACEAGPFGRLDPLVRHYWYDFVMEGLPLWVQSPTTIAHVAALPLIGLVGAGVAVRDGRGEARTRWAVMLFLLAGATLAALVTQRAGGVANLLAAPAAVHLLYPLLGRARAIVATPKRLAATLGVFLLAAPGLASGAAIAALSRDDPGEAAERHAARCRDGEDIGAMRVLPRGNVLAPLDISPTILLLTPLGAVASGHHRGAAAMHDVIAAFAGSDAQAHAIVARRRLDYVAFCPGMSEIQIYENAFPNGFLAHLDQGRAPDWLMPVPIPHSPVKVWRVR
jgi:hypothetical protein